MSTMLASRTHLVIDCQTVADGHIHGGEMELRNFGDGFRISVTRTAAPSGIIDVAIFIVMDAIAKFDGTPLG